MSDNEITANLERLLRKHEEINRIKDLDALLDRVLHEVRDITNADAGSIYLREGGKLRFSYVQNESLFSSDASRNKFLYSDHAIPIDDKSIAGYVALSKSPLVIDDAYDLPPDMPVAFNPAFDKRTGYQTRSILAVPLKTGDDNLVGVMQIINRQDEKGESIPFSDDDQLYVAFFAQNASVSIEKARMTRDIILRMVKIAEMRDPKETGAHVNRVGAYSIETYQRWAEMKGIPPAEIKKFKDSLRISSMLHDVGKVAISDAVLKKPGRFTPEERAIMMNHSIYGYNLFAETYSELDTLSGDIALRHHEKWDGTGYPGRYTETAPGIFEMGPGLKGEETPIAGRIVAIADVYDALICSRCYKDAWPEEKVLDILKEDSGSHFDPELIESFFSIHDVIRAIREKFKE